MEEQGELSVLSPDTLSSIVEAIQAADEWVATKDINGRKQCDESMQYRQFVLNPDDNGLKR